MAPPLPTTGETPPASAVPSISFLTSAFIRLPFPFPSSTSKLSVLDHAASDYAHAHSVSPLSALLSAADRCFKAFSEAIIEHPLFKSIFSLHSDRQKFCQIHCRSPKAATLPSAHSFAAILPGDSVAGLVVANGITNFLNIYNTLLVIRLVLTWFPNSPPAIVSPLSTLCDPYLNIFRGIIPPLGGLDLSPILAFIVLNVFTSTAAALPAELPVSTVSHLNKPNQHMPLNLTTAQEKWMRRICSKTPKHSNGNN